MKNFTYCNPTRIEFGAGKEENIGQYISEYGIKKVLIVYGSERIKQSGLFDAVTHRCQTIKSITKRWAECKATR